VPPVRIVVDERERKSRIPELIKEAGGSVEYAQLPVGDYIVSSEQVVERKTVSDLVGSIYDGRLYIQCSQLVKHFQKPVILIQGDIADLERIPPDASEEKAMRLSERLPLAYDALATVMMEFRIPVIHVPTANHAAKFLVLLAGRNLKDGQASGPLLRKIKKENPVLVQQLSVLSSVPGVGNKLAARMLKKFVTPLRALNASAAELATIPGFGLARAERVRKILDSPDSVSPLIQRTLFDT
jgi:DNA excision repair protein ERCC-4